jgi:hypothetical protein
MILDIGNRTGRNPMSQRDFLQASLDKARRQAAKAALERDEAKTLTLRCEAHDAWAAYMTSGKTEEN